jgi:hypothetical protein
VVVEQVAFFRDILDEARLKLTNRVKIYEDPCRSLSGSDATELHEKGKSGEGNINNTEYPAEHAFLLKFIMS